MSTRMTLTFGHPLRVLEWSEFSASLAMPASANRIASRFSENAVATTRRHRPHWQG